MKKEKITVFTPTYNREKLLHRVFNSLNTQTTHNFIWLVIDDGSIDNTRQLIEEFKKKAKFKIEYIYQQNGGKHTAHNKAVNNCHTDYLLILDSDDFLSSNAIECLNSKLFVLENNQELAGMIGNRYNVNDGTVIGTEMPNIKYASGIELYQKYGLKGDTLRLYKLKILNENLFPVIKEERFVPENVVFDKIDLKYKLLILHEKLYYCDYQNDGYSNNIYFVHSNNPIGYALSLKSSAETSINLISRIKWTILYIIWCNKTRFPNCFKDFKHKLLFLLLFPFSKFLIIIKYPKFFFENFEKKL